MRIQNSATKLVSLLGILGALSAATAQDKLPIVNGVETQPLKAASRRVVQTLEFLGEPLSAENLGRYGQL